MFLFTPDHVGWTPLHEACNHGSKASVEALLAHRPAPHLETAVDGISPLKDALVNGHLDIAKLLLEHAGGRADTFRYIHTTSFPPGKRRFVTL